MLPRAIFQRSQISAFEAISHLAVSYRKAECQSGNEQSGGLRSDLSIAFGSVREYAEPSRMPADAAASFSEKLPPEVYKLFEVNRDAGGL